MMSASQARNWQQTRQEAINPTKDRQPDTKHQVKVKPNKRWVTSGEKLLYTLFSAIAIMAFVFVVSFSSTTDTLNRQVQQLEQNVNEQQTTNQNLSYKVKEYSNPDRILRIAKENGLKIQNTKIKQTSTISN